MDFLYLFLKYLHILLAIVAVGFNATYGIWLARAGKDPRYLSFALRGVKFLDDRIANPAYGLLLVTGMGMVGVGGLSLATFWIGASLALLIVALALGLFVYTPTLRNQIQVLEKDGPDTSEYRSLSNRGTVVGLVLMVLVLTIIFMMVAKPVL